MEGLHSGHQEKYYEVKDQRILGEDSFVDRIEAEKGEREDAVYDIPIEVIAQEVSRTTGVAQGKLYSLTRNREEAQGRSMVAYLARVISGHVVTDVARHFQRSPMRMSQAIIQFEDRLLTALLKPCFRKNAPTCAVGALGIEDNRILNQ